MRERKLMTIVLDYLQRNALAGLAFVCSLLALAGASYAALAIPRNSVGTAQLRNHSITAAKLDPAEIAGSVRAWAVVGASGNVIAGAGKPSVTITPSTPGNYGIRWGVKLPKTCATVATVDYKSPGPTETVPIPGGTTESVVAGYVSEVSSGQSNGSAKHPPIYTTGLITFNQAGQPTPLAFDVAVIC
jgi:hypothetical protein